jgi:hypothetical protein
VRRTTLIMHMLKNCLNRCHQSSSRHAALRLSSRKFSRIRDQNGKTVRVSSRTMRLGNLNWRKPPRPSSHHLPAHLVDQRRSSMAVLGVFCFPRFVLITVSALAGHTFILRTSVAENTNSADVMEPRVPKLHFLQPLVDPLPPLTLQKEAS